MLIAWWVWQAVKREIWLLHSQESSKWLVTGEKALRQRADRSGNHSCLAQVIELWLNVSPLCYWTPIRVTTFKFKGRKTCHAQTCLGKRALGWIFPTLVLRSDGWFSTTEILTPHFVSSCIIQFKRKWFFENCILLTNPIKYLLFANAQDLSGFRKTNHSI